MPFYDGGTCAIPTWPNVQTISGTGGLFIRVYTSTGGTTWPGLSYANTVACSDATTTYWGMGLNEFVPRAPSIMRHSDLTERMTAEYIHLRASRPPELTDEERLAHMAAAHESRQRIARDNAQRANDRAEADAKAHKILMHFLSPEQRRDFESSKSFRVIGESGARYRVRWGRVGNIDVLTAEDRVSHRLCVHPSDGSMPVADVMLAQLLHLQSNDNEVVRIANRHPA